MNRGHSSAQHLKRVLVDSDGGNMHLITCVAGVPEQCAVCRAFDTTPDAPVAVTSTVAMLMEINGRISGFLGDIIAAHVMDVFPQNSDNIPVRTKNP